MAIVTAEERARRYIRQISAIIDGKTGKPVEFEIPKPIALYILDGNDKIERLEKSNRKDPCASYSGQSRVWREDRK